MREMERMADQLQRAFHSNAWHGPALLEALAGVTAGDARRRPISNAHTIWELVQHLTSWKDIVTRRLAGERIDEVSPDRDWPPVTDPSDAAWGTTLQQLGEAHAKLMEAVKVFDPMRLICTVPGMNYTYYIMIHGVPQHDGYHAGQITLLKRSLTESESAASN